MRDGKTVKVVNSGGQLGFVLFVSFTGAAVYFVQQTDGFWGVVVAILKAAVWPAFVVYEVLQNLGV